MISFWRSDTKLLSPEEIANVINVYNAHQIFNNLFNEEFRTVQFLAPSIGGLIMIAMSYLIIGFYSHLPFFLFGAVALTLMLTFCIFYLVTNTSAQLNKSSTNMLLSFLKNRQQCRIMGIELTKRFKAYKPLNIQLGHFVTVNMSTYPLFMNEVVIANVVNLLLM